MAKTFTSTFLDKARGYRFAASNGLGIAGYEKVGLVWRFTFTEE